MAGEVFISYQRADEHWAQMLHAQLRAEGVTAWYDSQIVMGQDWRQAIAKVLESCTVFVLLFSSSTAASGEVAKELAAAILEKKLIIPVRLEDVAPKGAFLYELASRNWLNAFENTEVHLAELARRIAQWVGSGGEEPGTLLLDHEAAAVPAMAPRAQRVRRRLIPIAAVAILAAAAAGFLWTQRRPAPAPSAAPAAALIPRIAVNSFEVLGNDDALRQFAGGLKAEILEQFSRNRVPAVSRAPNEASGPAAPAATGAGVAYAFSGTIERSGDNILVHAHLDDARQGVTVWSSDFQGRAGDPRPLQQEISAQAASVGATAAYRDQLANGDTDAMSLLIKGSQFAYRNVQTDREAEWDNARQLAAKFPNLAAFQANFAIVGAMLSINSTPSRAAELRASAKSAALRARALAPKDSAAYFAQSLLIPSIGGWGQREQFLLQGLAIHGVDAAVLTNNESNLLREVGRLKEAVEYGRQSQVVIPTSGNRDATLILALAATGNSFDAGPFAESAAKSWPTHPAIWYARFEMALYSSQWDAALALLAPGTYVPIAGPMADAWRSALIAAQSGNAIAKKSAIRQLIVQLGVPSGLLVAPPYEVMGPGGAIAMLAMLDDLDATFAQAEIYLKPGSYADSSFLFAPNLARFRRDARFIPLAARIGLLEYWQTSGKWPDFCAEPGLPYDCRQTAR